MLKAELLATLETILVYCPHFEVRQQAYDRLMFLSGDAKLPFETPFRIKKFRYPTNKRR
jgi:hypothetical protein